MFLLCSNSNVTKIFELAAGKRYHFSFVILLVTLSPKVLAINVVCL